MLRTIRHPMSHAGNYARVTLEQSVRSSQGCLQKWSVEARPSLLAYLRRSAGEVLWSHRLDELPEFLNLLLLVLVLDEDAGFGQDVRGGKQRHRASNSERDRVGRPAGDLPLL